ncbi:CRISPR-associated endoribonuclease Cas6 [Jeotgalibaca ciconiae]|uniref:CRISPR-associated endoribonuclease Cas6 n=1 Tax=Jeotgalibaca ciconiae TaxID=2496265 RepID=UPI0013DFF03B|nr:CRISPR-associated endoribonuclease Cas6 [Jeotgalibaca ciconiae]
MRKITLICEKERNRNTNKLAVYIHGWLMENLEEEFVSALHNQELNHYTLHVERKNDYIYIVVTLLDEDKTYLIEEFLLSSTLNEIIIKSTNEKYKIVGRNIEDKSLSELTERFYQEDSKNTFQITFLSPTSFKSNGEYIMFPDLRFIFQSLMNRYSFVFEGNKKVDKDLLDELCDKTKIVSYRLNSSYYPVHQSYIPGYFGEIKIRCKGNKTLVNYLNMILEFGEFSGVGVKTAMGMGAILVKQV